MQIKDLKPNVKNPRKISESKLRALKSSVEKFGDLSGFVYNKTSGQLISGHQRTKVIPSNAKIKIEKKHESPTKYNTVAEGYVLFDGERFKYREVAASPKWEAEAMVAANKHGGEWDTDTLGALLSEFSDIDLDAIGFDTDELSEIGINLEAIDSDDFNFDLDSRDDDADLSVNESRAIITDDDAEQSDEDYVKNTPETTEQIDTMNPNENVKIDEVKEDKKLDRRYVIVIDCENEEHKKSIKEKIDEIVKELKGKIF